MEPNGLGGGMFSSIGSGLLGGVENPLQQQQQNLPNPQNPHPMHHPQMVSYASSHHDTDIPQPQPQQSIKHGYPYSAKINQQMALSDEDEAGFAAEDNVSSGDPKRKISQWHRMKWTDTMVKLLIMAVYYIGDEAGSEAADKKKPTGLSQKKGKWKSVSRAMMQKGYFVSPQQCEDKFNDLNKRYKRVNDILGKGTACLVVENHNLLDTMDLSPKVKEEVRKLLNSKHLFFREMCAYHNSCGHMSTIGPQQSPEVGTEPSQAVQPQQQQQRCSHSSGNGMANLGKPESEGLKILKGVNREEEDDEDEDDDSEDSSDEDEEESGEGVSRDKTGNAHEDEDENYDARSSMKRPRKAEICVSSKLMPEISNEVTGVLQDGGRSTWEKKQWIKRKIVQLEEQQIRYQIEGFELEKQRLKWVRFSGKKEREMERAKLENQQRLLENERMVLLIRQKELELLNLHHQQKQQHSSN